MDSCDVLIVGGGPAGSSCAWKLRNSGLEVALLDRCHFPRDKVCGGWITPGVVSELEMDPREYRRERILQPITGFRTGAIFGNGSNGAPVETDFGTPVSYGIRRREFDDYLLKRCGARVFQGEELSHLERCNGTWLVNAQIRARILVGAGGHFCPVARFMGARTASEPAVVARESEFEMSSGQIAGCRVAAERPELYFCADLKGYGWCFRKGNVLNVGLGRADPHGLSSHMADFQRYLKESGRLLFDIPAPRGHAYLLHAASRREIIGDGYLLIGDAAGLAYSQSGEGILPAIQSGILAADVVAGAGGQYGRDSLEAYRTRLDEKLGNADPGWITRAGRRVPPEWLASLAGTLLRNRWFVREVVLKRWFLRAAA